MNKNKIHITITAMLTMMLSSAHAQDTSQNYVQTVTMLEENSKSSVSAVQYYNGLGYPTVSVANASTNGGTAATLTTYDGLGREDRKFLPVPGNKFEIIDEKYVKSQAMFYQDNSAFTQNHYDALDRVTAVDIAGDKWRKAGKQNKTEYLANTDADNVRKYKEVDSKPVWTKGDFYLHGSLTKEVVKDADNKTVITFKDLFGNVILQRANDGTTNLDTYYVYDEIGRLRFVLTPQYQKSQSVINYYEYSYDYIGRVKTKKLPGCKEITYWYDKADRIAYMKDPALGSRYRFYLYDKLGRLCVQGTCTDGTRDSTQLSTTSYVSGTNNGICKTGYTAPYTISNPKLEIVNYYDNYNFKDKDKRFSSSMPTVSVNDNQKQYSIGSLTGTVVYATNGKALGTVNVYDQKGQVVRSLRKGLDGYVEDVNTAYTFTGAVDNTTASVNVKYGNEFVATTNYTYNYGVKTNMKLSVAHGSSAMARETEYKYDLIGRLQSKNRQLYNSYNSTCSYTYDVHGWLTMIYSGGFQEYLYYAEGVDDTKYYNGNISAYRWKNRDESDYKGYIFKYDGNNRLREAVFGQGNNLASNKNYYSEYVDEYDRNGNILRLKRRGLTDKMHGGFGNVDDLYMSYSGNKLTSVRDEASRHPYEGATDFDGVKGKEYALKYNNAGSLVSDEGRNIAKIQYDSNNNPSRIQFTNGNVTKYVYSATGEKLRVIYQTAIPNIEVAIGSKKDLDSTEIKCTETVDYLLGGALTLRNGRIDKYQFEEGYCQARKAGDKDYFTFCYYDQDHLGNIRQVTQDYNGMSNGKVIQTMNYYPFGAEFCDNSTKSYVQNHKYNGKEFDNMHGLNTYDYGARQYNPITARWDRMDPLCEADYGVSPYSYCNNSPINAVDPDGNFTVFINGFRPWAWDIAYKNALSEYWNSHDKDFDRYFGQNHDKAEYRDGSLGGALAMCANLVLGGYSAISSGTRYKYGYEQGRADVIGLLQKLERNSDGTIIEPLILATHSMGGQYGKGYAQAIMDYYNKHKEMFQGFNMYEFDFAPYQADKQKAVKGVKTIQIHDKCDLIATPTLIEGAEGYFVSSNLTPCMVPHFINNTLFWDQVRNLSEGSYRVINGQIVKQ